MAFCVSCARPIEPLDSHCISCLGVAHAETAIKGWDCPHCTDMLVRVLRNRRAVVCSSIGVRTAAESLVDSPPPRDDGCDSLSSRLPPRASRSPVSFSENLCPPSDRLCCVSFGTKDENAMSFSAYLAGSKGSADLQEELMRILSKAVQELELSWDPPQEPVRSRLDSWFWAASRYRSIADY